ncbi:sulfotransferase [Pseudoalteromonas sp. YIC-656]|uniref:tetratricopeptide repeat-containing sulfotransferase family protein n=1 Tax=Pseudoalteromonas pernae TaxID=3118054 RepID=UPI0032422467
MSASTLAQHIATRLANNQVQQAHALLVTELQKNPAHHEAWFLLAQVNAHVGDLNKALKLIDKALNEHRNSEYLLAKAKYLYLIGNVADCTQLLIDLDALPLNDAVALDTLANLYSRLGNYVKAHQYHVQAVTQAPGNADINVNAAISYAIMAKPEQAMSLLQQAIQINPANYRAHFIYAEHADAEQATAHTQQLNTLLATQTHPIAQQHLHHALALELEKLSRFDDAFDAFTKSKQAVERRVQFNPQRHRDFCQQVKSLPSLTPSDNQSAPVFIAGMPRSGTTLVDKILCQSAQLASLGELNDIAQSVKRLSQIQTPAVLTPEIVNGAAHAPASALAQSYHVRYHALKMNAPRGCDKQPFNFYYIDFILSAFPKAKIILMVRNKEDCCMANMRQLYQVQSPFHHYAFKLEHIAAFYDDYLDLAKHFAAKYPEQVVLQSYEELVSEGEQTMRHLYAFCDLPYQQDCLDFYATPSACATASKLQIRQPLNTRSVGYWRHYEQKYRAIVAADKQ